MCLRGKCGLCSTGEQHGHIRRNQTNKPPPVAALAVQLLDLSDTGVRLIVSHALDVPAEVEIIIGGYGMKQPLKRMGTVRWQVKMENGSYCAGIEFQKYLPYRDWQNLASPS
ncbi:MAG: PilZ domain-containing protein [Gemmataceae bacterium]|nr:PilZ domain-containing protein [Gemmataceae bacterium]